MPQKMNVLLFHRIALNQSDMPFLPYKNERNGEKAVSIAVTKIGSMVLTTYFLIINIAPCVEES
jgi:hypothetical protein